MEERKVEMRQCKITPIVLVYILFSVGTGAMLLSLIVSKGAFLEKIVYDFSYFADFFDHVRRFYLGLDNVYLEGMHACFPPLAYMLYGLTASVIYRQNIDNPDAVSTNGAGMLVLCMLTAMLAAGFVFASFRLYQEQNMAAKKFLIGLLLISYPFWLAIERGNMSLVVLIVLLYAMALMDSEKGWERELALILIAIAAGLKLYPAVFGVLYLAEKRYREAARLVLYGLFFFLAPFLFFQGAIGLKLFLHNISAVNSGATGVSITGITGRIGVALGVDLALAHSIGKVISGMYFAVVLLLCFSRGKSWKTITLLSSLMIVFVAASGTYCLIYCVIPFFIYLNEMRKKESYKKLDYVYAVLFTQVFTAYPVKAFGSSGMLYISLYLLLAVLIVDEGWQAVRTWTDRRKQVCSE